jgi:hypothetical protein
MLRSGQRPGQRFAATRRFRRRQTARNRSTAGILDGASRTRTGGLLGAIQACASTEFGLFAGVSRWRWPGLRPALSASFRSFRLGSGQRSKVWPDLRSGPSYVRPTCRPSHNPPPTPGAGCVRAHTGCSSAAGTDGCPAGLSSSRGRGSLARATTTGCGMTEYGSGGAIPERLMGEVDLAPSGA